MIGVENEKPIQLVIHILIVHIFQQLMHTARAY